MENEAFLKMVEDPMVYIRQRELEARSQIVDNPLRMKQILKEIEALKKGGKKKKDKKEKKEKKAKKHSKKSKRSPSSSSSGSERSSVEQRREKRRSRSRERR